MPVIPSVPYQIRGALDGLATTRKMAKKGARGRRRAKALEARPREARVMPQAAEAAFLWLVLAVRAFWAMNFSVAS